MQVDVTQQSVLPNWFSADHCSLDDFTAQIAAGKEALPSIEQLAKTSDNPQVKTAAEAIIDQILAADKTGPTLVTLHYDDASPRVAPATHAVARLAHARHHSCDRGHRAGN